MNLRYDLRSLQIFVAVVEESNIARAAERHHTAASAASKRVADLEAVAGVPLLVRMSRGVEPTAAGRALLERARAVLEEVGRMENTMADYAGGAKGQVRLLVNKSAIVQFLPRELASFAVLFPEILVDLEEENTPAILRGVAEDRADLGIFTRGAGSADGFVVHAYRQDRLVVLVPRDHVLATRTALRFADILPFDLVGLHAVSAWNALLTRGAQEANLPLNVRYRVTSFDAVTRMVAAGLGVALVPDGVVDTIDPAAIVSVPFHEPWSRRELCIASRSSDTLSLAARRLLNHLVASGQTASS